MNQNQLEARAITESALLELFDALSSSTAPDDFFASADAIVAKPFNQLSLPVSHGIPNVLTVESKTGVDRENAPRVHEYLGEMDRANASDARLWVYLAFATYRSYMEKRWPLSPNDGGSWKGRVRDRWLLHNGAITRGRLVRHGIARLWWVAHLTYDCDSGTPREQLDGYALTQEVFKSEDRINALFDREVGAIPAVMKSVLNHAASLESAATDKYVQRIMRYLRLVNGYRDVGSLNQEVIEELVTTASKRSTQLK